MIYHIKRATRYLIFWSLIACAVSLTAVRLVLLSVDHYKADLSVRVSELMGVPVEIGHLHANMRGYSPELILKDFKILSAVTNESPIQFKEIRLGINLVDFLKTGDQFASSWVTLVGAKLTIKRKQDGSIAIVGLKGGDEKPFWLLQGGQYEVLQSEVSWLDELNQIKPVTMSEVNVAIINKSQQHQINALLKLPEAYGEELIVSMQFKGNIFETASIDGSVFVEGKKIKPTEWVPGNLSVPVSISSGSVDFKCWGELQQSKLDSIVGDVQLQQLTLTRPDKASFLVQHLSTQFHWFENDGEWRLQVPQMLLETVDNKWPVMAFNIFGEQTEDNKLHKLGLFIDTLDLQKVAYWVDFFAPLSGDQRLLLKQAQLKGFLEQLSLFVDLDEQHFAIKGDFAHINVAPSQAIPGVENLTGYLKGTDQQGQLVLATEEAHLLTLGVFRQALDITKLTGTVDWQQTPDEYLFSSALLTLNSPDLETDTRFNLRIPKAQDQSAFLDLQSGFSIADVSKATRYLPVNTMRKTVVEWLDRGLVKGRVPKGDVLFYGNLNDFPFSKGQGVFEIPFQIDQVDLVYLSAWPSLTELGGDVLFLQDSLQVNLKTGSSKDVKINQAMITLPDLNAAEQLFVKATLNTGILQGLEFLQQTPLKSSADNLLNAIDPQGNTDINLDLKLPLAEGVNQEIDGVAHLANAKLKVKALDLDVIQMNGEVKFNEHGLYSNLITAEALNNPIKATITNSNLLSTVNVTGHADARDLEKQFKLPGWHLAQGATDYVIKLNLPADQSAPELLVESNLQGMGLDFPSTLAKTKEQQRALAMTFNLGLHDLLPIQINYDKQLKAVLNYDLKTSKIESATILLGAGDTPQNQNQDFGIKLFLNKERLALQDWISLVGSLATSEDTETTGALSSIKEIKVHSEHGLWKKADLGLIDIALKPEANYWIGNLDSLLAKGKFKIPKALKGADSIQLDLDELDLSVVKQLKSQSETGSTLSPEFMPLIQINSEKTRWHDVPLGKLTVETERIFDGITFKRFDLMGDDQKLSLSGYWTNKGRYSATHVEGSLNIPQAGQLLAKLGLSKDFTETHALINVFGNWAGAPYQFSLDELKGHLDIDFKNGRILGIEPGFGRVLGILAVAQWVKRFQLDFSDVFGEGLSFSSIKGRFDLQGGLASTRDLIVDAVPAKISIAGNADLVRETVDYSVNVVPKSADAVPVAGTIMGKLTDFIGLALTGKDQQGFFFGSQYLVKGAWGNVQIIPLHENDGLLQKTWDGITGFPWVKQSTER
ncbi:MAG: YhdP family protein [Methylococcales bacterium]